MSLGLRAVKGRLQGRQTSSRLAVPRDHNYRSQIDRLPSPHYYDHMVFF